jgi:hypothetical protein
MRVGVTIGSAFEAGTPTKLFDGPYFYNLIERMYDVSPDGRFLMIKESRPSNQPAPSPRLIVLRTLAALRRRVPGKQPAVR